MRFRVWFEDGRDLRCSNVELDERNNLHMTFDDDTVLVVKEAMWSHWSHPGKEL